MNKKENIGRLFILLVAGINILVQTAIKASVWYHYYHPHIKTLFWEKGHWFILFIYFITLFLFSHVYGGLRIDQMKKDELLFSQVLSTLCANFIFYLIICLLTYGFPTIFPLLIATLADILFIILWLKLIFFAYLKLFPPCDALLIYGEDTNSNPAVKLQSRSDKFHIKESIGISSKGLHDFSRLEGYQTIVLWDIPNGVRSDLLKHCYGKNIQIYSVPKISDVIIAGAKPVHYFDTPLLLLHSNPLTLEQLACKRLIDICLSSLLLLICFPIMLITALCIKCYDRGPILYKQIRCTRNEREFNIYKFRSMVVEAEKDGIARLSSKYDNRITPIGKIIRKLRIDELPQLFNILKGDMSFVGPRPERPEILKEYKKDLPEFEYRTKIKAGLTGYAQIYGKYNTTPYDKLKLDLNYIQSYTLLLDFELIILTIKILFIPESTEGIGENQITPITKSKR